MWRRLETYDTCYRPLMRTSNQQARVVLKQVTRPREILVKRMPRPAGRRNTQRLLWNMERPRTCAYANVVLPSILPVTHNITSTILHLLPFGTPRGCASTPTRQISRRVRVRSCEYRACAVACRSKGAEVEEELYNAFDLQGLLIGRYWKAAEAVIAPFTSKKRFNHHTWKKP